jgi:dedicator of cytokinesis protein 3
MQTALAYVNVSYPESALPHTVGSSPDFMAAGPLPTPAHSVFPESSYHKPRSLSLGSHEPNRLATAKFFHIYLDLRAFVASPCAPGETAELFFSLYRRSGQFVTEDFCAILNHNGVLARDPTKRIRTLFTDLALGDVQDPVYLVCRIVRSGALKLGNGPSDGRRGSDFGLRSDSSAPTGWSDPSSPSSPRGNGMVDVASPFRRPFACAVLELTQLARMIAEDVDVTPAREHQMPIFTPTNEASFSMIHQNIISKNSKEYEKTSR